MFKPIKTSRLTLRRLSESDLDAFLAYRNDPEVAKFQGWGLPYPRDQAGLFVREQSIAEPGVRGSWFQFAIEWEATHRLIGDCGLRTGDDGTHGEIGFTLAREHQGHGFASEAVQAVTGYAFSALGFRRIVAITDCRNDRSIAMLNRIGFKREKTMRRSYYDRTVREWCDEYLYALEPRREAACLSHLPLR
ncbi:MAG: GNAT family N-acetyltransferase [Candidatus Binataceae bacterium]